MDFRAIDKDKALSELKSIAKKLDSVRDAAKESQFIECLDAISTNHEMMIDIQTDINCLCDITKLLCDLCGKSRSLGEWLNAWLRFNNHVPSQTMYTVFLVMDIAEFRKCAKLFHAAELKSVQMQILDVMCSYLDGNKQKITNWLKQLFYCVISDNDLKQLSLYSDGKMDSFTYKRQMVHLINQHATPHIRSSEQQTRYGEYKEDAPNGIVESTFYEEPSRLEHRNKNYSQEWILIHSSDDEDNEDQNNNISAFQTSVSTKPKSSCSSNSTSSTIQPEESRKTTELLANQEKDCIGYKSNRKRRSAQVAMSLTKSQLNADKSDVDDENDVYGFDEDDNEPALKKKRRTMQPKKRKKPEAWPRIKKEEKKEKHRPPKVYTVRVKTPVGARAKINRGKQSTKVSNSSVEATEFLENGMELLLNTLPNESDTKFSANVSKVSECPVKLPKEILENINKINESVKLHTVDRSNVTESRRKCQSKDIVVIDSSKKPESKKKPRPRKLYSETEPEFDGMDMDQAEAQKNQIKQRPEPILNTSNSSEPTLNSSSDSIDEFITNEISVSASINATCSSHTSFTKDNSNLDISNENSNAMPDSTDKSIVRYSDVMTSFTRMEIVTNDASDDCNSNRPHQKHREIVEQLKIASSALCRILSILDSQTKDFNNNTYCE